MFQEVIVCDLCGAEGCTVKEIAVQSVNPQLTMTEFAEANNRAFEINCLRCGHKHRFQFGKPEHRVQGKE